MQENIPNRLIFIWFGKSFPLTNQIAVKSAVRMCNPEEVMLIHDGLSAEDDAVHDLTENYRVVLKEATEDWFDNLPEGGEVARSLFKNLSSPVSRSNILRLAVLWKLGGIYLDMDTITIRSLDPLRSHEGFCGCETVAVPGYMYKNLNPLKWVWTGFKVGFRNICRYLPKGYAFFKMMESFYDQSVNNAVLGSMAKNPFLEQAFLTIKEIPELAQGKRYRLGTHLLQELTKNKSSENMHVFDRSYFYPLGPEISVFWFRKNSARYCDKLIDDRTHVIHWYSSVQKKFMKQSIDAQYLAGNPTSAFAILSAEYIEPYTNNI